MVRLVSLVFIIALSLVVPRTAYAQALTGTLIGTVQDEQGGVVPGAMVRVSSRALIGGPAAAPTNEKGQLRFQARR